MTIKFNDIYINETATVTGPYESKGPLGKYFDLCHKDCTLEKKIGNKLKKNQLKKLLILYLKKVN